jgi:hypothetical protein
MLVLSANFAGCLLAIPSKVRIRESTPKRFRTASTSCAERAPGLHNAEFP